MRRQKSTSDDAAIQRWSTEYFERNPVQAKRGGSQSPIVPKPKKGLPDGFPQPTDIAFDKHGRPRCGNLEEIMDAASHAYGNGYGAALGEAFSWHFLFARDTPLPLWLATLLMSGFVEWKYSSDSLDQILRLKKCTARTRGAMQFRDRYAVDILKAVTDAKRRGISESGKLFETIGDVFGCKEKTVRRILQSLRS